jgi:hypothetical protein
MKRHAGLGWPLSGIRQEHCHSPDGVEAGRERWSRWASRDGLLSTREEVKRMAENERHEDDDAEGQKHIHMGTRADDEVKKDADDAEGQKHIRMGTRADDEVKKDADDAEGQRHFRAKKDAEAE